MPMHLQARRLLRAKRTFPESHPAGHLGPPKPSSSWRAMSLGGAPTSPSPQASRGPLQVTDACQPPPPLVEAQPPRCVAGHGGAAGGRLVLPSAGGNQDRAPQACTLAFGPTTESSSNISPLPLTCIPLPSHGRLPGQGALTSHRCPKGHLLRSVCLYLSPNHLPQQPNTSSWPPCPAPRSSLGRGDGPARMGLSEPLLPRRPQATPLPSPPTPIQASQPR